MTHTLRIAQARPTDEHLRAILGLIEEARIWLPTKGTNQWSQPWPNQPARDERVRRGLEVGATWVVWDKIGDKDILAATATIATRPNPAVWSNSTCNLADLAVYAHRLITARDYAGWGLGAELIDWTGLRGHDGYGAEWIRIDVWASNEALHGYYMKRGFKPCGTCPDLSYPSGQLFQKSVSEIAVPTSPLFEEYEQAPDVFATQSDLCMA